METSQSETRFRRAMRHAVWFGAAFTIGCALLTLALATGLIGREEDASVTGIMTLVGALVFAANVVANRLFLP